MNLGDPSYNGDFEWLRCFKYDGMDVILKKFRDMGFTFDCPSCKKEVLVSYEKHDIRFLEIDGIRFADIKPSVVCPHDDCDLHIWVDDGYGRDC